jgi:hypothetical protein
LVDNVVPRRPAYLLYFFCTLKDSALRKGIAPLAHDISELDAVMNRVPVVHVSPFSINVLHFRTVKDGSRSLFEITISMRYTELAVPIFGSEEILSRAMPAWCLLNAGGHSYRAPTSLCCPSNLLKLLTQTGSKRAAPTVVIMSALIDLIPRKISQG